MTATTAPRLGPHPVRPADPRRRRPARAPRALLALAVLLGTVLGTLFATAGPAAAHAALTGSDPKDGAVVETAPGRVSLTFSEQIAMGKDSIRVLEPSAKRADTGAVLDLSEGGTVTYGVELRDGLPDGTYTVAWQGVSADSHPISGAFTFSVGAPSKTAVALPDQEPGGGAVGLLYDIARYAAYTSFALMVGAVAFILLCWRRGAGVRPLQRLVARSWVALTASTLAMLLLRGPYTLNGSLTDVFDLAGLQPVLESKTGAALVSRLLLLGAAALFIAVLFGAYAKETARREAEGADDDGDAGDVHDAGGSGAPGNREKDLSFGLAVGGTVVAAGIAATWALSEHASTGIQPGLAMPLDVIHLLAVACWLGGLAALLTALYRAPSIEPAAVRAFSRVAFVSVIVLTATGLYQSWRQVGSWSALTGTSYGQWLLAKVALVAVMVGIAWFSRKWTARLATTATDAPQPGEADDTDEGGEAEEAESGDERGDEGAGSGDASGLDPARAAQLARQRTAVATALRKKERDADPDRAGLRRSVLAEAGIAVVLLAVTTVLTTTEPGRTAEAAKDSTAPGAAAPTAPGATVELKLPFDTGGQGGSGTVRLTLDPARPGGNELHLWVNGKDGAPLDVPELKLSFTLEAKQIGPLPITPERLAAGHWSAGSVQIPMPGDWKVQVTVRTSDIDQATVSKNLTIG
ncbi:copper resistance protein CopC [Streptomyces sp. NPDC000594]|uniref:copper resistance CopC/CopD family protein n=1 Tax=Streptomyces sp. NPDC000594 TaxID=3154261 RepID=UPI00331D9D61